MADGIQFSLLGPVRASIGGVQLDLGPARERAMLSVLLCRVNEVMCGAELLDAVWDDKPPGSGIKVIPTYIYRLRRAMAPAAGLVSIESLRDGYVLRTEPDNLDVTRFSQAVALGREPHGDADMDDVRVTLGDALALWRGTPFTGLAGPLLAAERRRLEEQRLGLLEERFDLELRCGRHADVVGELQALCEAHPWRERFAALLMITLYRCGRQADALAVYHTARSTLRDSLGIDPGAELAAAHQTVLRSDRQTERAVPARGSRPVRRDLPAAPRGLIGRHAEVELLTRHAGDAPPVVAVDGMPGAGKTALGLRVAHALAHRYPDGQLYLDLQGGPAGAALDAAEALRRLLVAVGEQAIPETVTERAALWRAGLANRRMLLMLDNVTRSDQVTPLLPGAAGCATLVVGRRRLYGLPVTASATLGPLPAEAARRLLGQLVGERSLVDEPGAVAAVLAGCAGLPLAIVRAAAALRHRGGAVLAGFAERLAADPLRALRAEDDSLAAVFDPSVAACRPLARRVFTALGEAPRPVAELAAALGLARAEVDDALHELLDAGLAARDERGWYSHRLLVAYAATLELPGENPTPGRVRAVLPGDTAPSYAAPHDTTQSA